MTCVNLVAGFVKRLHEVFLRLSEPPMRLVNRLVAILCSLDDLH